jgi:hypothetical protein
MVGLVWFGLVFVSPTFFFHRYLLFWLLSLFVLAAGFFFWYDFCYSQGAGVGGRHTGYEHIRIFSLERQLSYLFDLKLLGLAIHTYNTRILLAFATIQHK